VIDMNYVDRVSELVAKELGVMKIRIVQGSGKNTASVRYSGTVKGLAMLTGGKAAVTHSDDGFKVWLSDDVVPISIITWIVWAYGFEHTRSVMKACRFVDECIHIVRKVARQIPMEVEYE